MNSAEQAIARVARAVHSVTVDAAIWRTLLQ